MGGIRQRAYFSTYPEFQTTNDLSLAIVIEYCGFKILFPGDLEEGGWLALLARPDFQRELAGVDVLVASHHGRENGYCEEVFQQCHPRAIVMSDKAIVHDTQRMTQTYRQRVIEHHPQGVDVATTGKQRHVLTTRHDGWIQFNVNERGEFWIYTEHNG
jgi:beta-lactamase superfamily II metal-dependent hydrolase